MPLPLGTKKQNLKPFVRLEDLVLLSEKWATLLFSPSIQMNHKSKCLTLYSGIRKRTWNHLWGWTSSHM